MSTDIPLTHLNHKNIFIAKKNKNSIIYRANDTLEFTKYTLIVTNAIKSLINNTKLPIQAWKLNKLLHKFFDFKITTKDLHNIYTLILHKRKVFINNPTLFNSKVFDYKNSHIALVNKPTIQNIEKKLKHIHSFDIIKINHHNLNYYKNSRSRFKKLIASIIEEFFFSNTHSTHNHTIHKLKTHINLRLKEMEISYKSTYKYQLEILSNVFRN
ncbi:hypothetical protein bcCo53_001563 (plasmid) [Borrelia coriaceae]|nr:hypothetical protein [Borrelia coriaceae]UPA17368.1 hypothetical protein bcCo53_001563 [Borrelia coriaceae]